MAITSRVCKRQRQRVAAAARADVQHGVGRPHQRAQRFQRRLVLAPRVGAEHARDRGVEVGRRRFAELLDLLAVGAHACAPRRAARRRPKVAMRQSSVHAALRHCSPTWTSASTMSRAKRSAQKLSYAGEARNACAASM